LNKYWLVGTKSSVLVRHLHHHFSHYQRRGVLFYSSSNYHNHPTNTMLFKILLPLFALTGSCSRLPQPKVPAVVRAPAPPSSLILRDVEANLEPRLESSEVFDIGFSLQNEELYAGYVTMHPHRLPQLGADPLKQKLGICSAKAHPHPRNTSNGRA